jgi:hypothetical protein
MSQTQELKLSPETNLDTYIKEIDLKLSGVFNVTAKHIEGTQMCEVQLPCRYKGKDLVIAVFEDIK